jgi:hypothetical protein
MALKWELIDKIGSSWLSVPTYVDRVEVPGGWLVRSWFRASSTGAISMVFVPDPEHSWVVEKDD